MKKPQTFVLTKQQNKAIRCLANAPVVAHLQREPAAYKELMSMGLAITSVLPLFTLTDTGGVLFSQITPEGRAYMRAITSSVLPCTLISMAVSILVAASL